MIRCSLLHTDVSRLLCSFRAVAHCFAAFLSPPSLARASFHPSDLDLPALYSYLQSQLASYQTPLFLRIQQQMETTGTFKLRKVRARGASNRRASETGQQLLSRGVTLVAGCQFSVGLV